MFRGLGRDVDPAAVDPTDVEAYLVGVDPSVRDDPAAAGELLARRRFAVPTVVTSLDGDDQQFPLVLVSRVDPASTQRQSGG